MFLPVSLFVRPLLGLLVDQLELGSGAAVVREGATWNVPLQVWVKLLNNKGYDAKELPDGSQIKIAWDYCPWTWIYVTQRWRSFSSGWRLKGEKEWRSEENFANDGFICRFGSLARLPNGVYNLELRLVNNKIEMIRTIKVEICREGTVFNGVIVTSLDGPDASEEESTRSAAHGLHGDGLIAVVVGALVGICVIVAIMAGYWSRHRGRHLCAAK
jgi:hypothetical protein